MLSFTMLFVLALAICVITVAIVDHLGVLHITSPSFSAFVSGTPVRVGPAAHLFLVCFEISNLAFLVYAARI